METYDPSAVSVIMGGAIITGFAEGTFIKAARNEDAFTYVGSSTGGGTRTKNANKSGTIEITLQSTSPSNAVLNGFANQDETSNDGIFSSLIRDNGGKDLVKGPSTWVKKKPDMEKAKELSNNVWLLEVSELFLDALGA